MKPPSAVYCFFLLKLIYNLQLKGLLKNMVIILNAENGMQRSKQPEQN